ncbi:MCE family protein [Mycobacteroides sp. LB1]|uniref:MCE family protein n=1 Tax=Mycobacteroides sp. LB1 TaxID=2750814 RepID=UPI0015DDDE49|nr:MCE family protein [Mycobacteroides sp. LB1]
MTRRLLAALVLIIAVTIAAAATWPQIGPVNQQVTLTAQFADVSGLYVGNVVSVLGMPVGTVTTITPNADYVNVTFTVDKKIKVPANVQAVTVSTSILTDRHIELTPPYREGPALRDGDLIGLARTKTPVQFDRVLAMVDRLAKALKGEGNGSGPVGHLIAIGNEVTSGRGPEIKDALDQLSQAMRLSADGGTQTKDNITRIVASLSSLTQAAVDNDTTIRKFGSDVHQLSRILADEDFGSGTAGKQMNQLLIEAADLLDKNRDSLKKTILQTTTITDTAVNKQREIAEVFDVLPLLAGNIGNAVDMEGGAIRAHFLLDKMMFDSGLTKEICNLMGLRQLGCSTGTLQDYGPDFGLTYMLDGLVRMGQ